MVVIYAVGLIAAGLLLQKAAYSDPGILPRALSSSSCRDPVVTTAVDASAADSNTTAAQLDEHDSQPICSTSVRIGSCPSR